MNIVHEGGTCTIDDGRGHTVLISQQEDGLLVTFPGGAAIVAQDWEAVDSFAIFDKCETPFTLRVLRRFTDEED